MREKGQDIMDGDLSYVGDAEAIVPEGWTPGQDLLSEASQDAQDNPLEELAGDTKDDGQALADALREPQTAPQEAKQEQQSSRKVTIKVNHKTEEVDVGAMTDEDLATLIQKSRAFDAQQKKRDADKYRAAYHQELDAGSTDAVARLVAEKAAGGVYPLEEEEQEKPEAPNIQTQTGNLYSDVTMLQKLYPNLKEIPDEVTQAVAAGAPVLSAYAAYEGRQKDAKIASLEKELQALRQSAETRSRAPVKGTTGGAAAKEPDLFELAFDSGNTFRW